MTADPSYRRAIPVMGTIAAIDVFGGHDLKGTCENAGREAAVDLAVERGLEWFRRIEACCTRFDPSSELMQLSRHIGAAVSVSAMLYEAVQFALAVAEASGGAFDPTMGLEMERRGFNREYRSGREVFSALSPNDSATDRPTYKDVRLDPASKSITLARPLLLDLGAVAKGLAMDMAARELRPFGSFVIDAGGDLYLGGTRPDGAPWSVGIRHPRANDDLIDAVSVSDRAVCTSGDYERRAVGDGVGGRLEHHILDLRSRVSGGASAGASVSATVIAPSAMLADALATASFVLGPTEGVSFLERLGVEGLIVSSALETRATEGLARQARAAQTAARVAPAAQGARP